MRFPGHGFAGTVSALGYVRQVSPLFKPESNDMKLIAKQSGYEIWARFDQDAKVYELFFDCNGESYTGWCVDSIKDAAAAVPHILAELV